MERAQQIKAIVPTKMRLAACLLFSAFHWALAFAFVFARAANWGTYFLALVMSVLLVRRSVAYFRLVIWRTLFFRLTPEGLEDYLRHPFSRTPELVPWSQFKDFQAATTFRNETYRPVILRLENEPGVEEKYYLWPFLTGITSGELEGEISRFVHGLGRRVVCK